MIINGIIRIIKSLENSSFLIDSVSETVEHKIKKEKANFLVFIRKFSCLNVMKYVNW